MKNMRKEFWKVELRSEKYTSMHQEIYVFASSATQAEEKGLSLINKKEYENPYVSLCEFIGYIEK